jgi:hypothetical protein
MRVWVIVPITKEMRVGAALGSETMFVRKNVHWTHFLSPIGKRVSKTIGFAMAAVLLYWMVKTEGDWGRQWLSMLIASVIAYWVLRSVLLRLFPLEFPQEILGATPESQEPIATHAVNRAVPARVWSGGRIVG